MADESLDAWRRLGEPWERLLWSRKRWQNETGAVNANAEHAAASLGMKGGTYRAYERPPTSAKAIKLTHQTAIRFARKFRVNWVWLLLGEGSPFDEELPPEQARVVRAMSEASSEEQRILADMVEAFMRRAGKAA